MEEISYKKHRRFHLGIMGQMAHLFLLGTILIALATAIPQRELARRSVVDSTSYRGESIAKNVEMLLDTYPTHDWLMRYWYEHADELDIDYDADFRASTKTEQKVLLLGIHHPDLQLRYASISEIEALSEEDQKLFAEINYSWFLTQLNTLKRSHHIDFLFVAVSEKPYDKQCFLLSAADEGAVRGTEYGQVYPIGTVKDFVTEDTQKAMEICAETQGDYLADAGGYMDYCKYLGSIDDHVLVTGVTYNISGIIDSVNAQARKSTTLTALYLIGLALLCLLFLYLRTMRPLKAVQQNIRLYRKTRESSEVVDSLNDIHANNEIGDLAEDVTDLVLSIDEYTEEIERITAERERISAELSVANRIQASMLPSSFPAFPGRHEFDIYASMNPAREVGGDFYNFLMIDDDHLCLMIADVSGKGVPAALFMVSCMIIISHYARMGKSPAQILTDSNKSIANSNPEDMFLTIWVGILELSTGTLTAANAGHEYPVIKKPGGIYKLFKDRHGIVLGSIDGVQYEEYSMELAPGSTIFVFTDGLTEAQNAEGELFGTDRVLDALNGGSAADPKGVLDEMTQAVHDFVQEEEQFDDLTMLCLTYDGPDENTDNSTE